MLDAWTSDDQLCTKCLIICCCCVVQGRILYYFHPTADAHSLHFSPFLPVSVFWSPAGTYSMWYQIKMNYSPLHWGWGQELNMLTTSTAVFWWPSLWKTTITARKWIFRLILLIVVTWTLQLPVHLAAREGFFCSNSDFAIIYKWELVWQVCHPPHWLPSQTVASLTPSSNTNLKHATRSCHTSAKRASALRTQIKLVGHLLPFPAAFWLS